MILRLVVAFNLERFVSICYPLRAHAFCNRKIATRICIGIYSVAFLLSVHWPISYVRDSCFNLFTNSTYYMLRLRDEHFVQVYERTMNFVSMTIFNIIPILLLFVLNSLIIRTLHLVINREPTTRDVSTKRRSQRSANAILFAVVILLQKFENRPYTISNICMNRESQECFTVYRFILLKKCALFWNFYSISALQRASDSGTNFIRNLWAKQSTSDQLCSHYTTDDIFKCIFEFLFVLFGQSAVPEFAQKNSEKFRPKAVLAPLGAAKTNDEKKCPPRKIEAKIN